MKSVFMVTILLLNCKTFAQELMYPELNVTPRASDRIKLEVREESGKAWSSHMPVMFSALSTLTAGALGASEVNPESDLSSAPALAMGVGTLWLGATAWAAMKYRPYRSAYAKLKKLPRKTMRQKLTLERLAEEEINSLRSLGKRVRWFSVATNVIASGLVAGNSIEESNGQIAGSLAAAVAFAPLIFNYHWESVANEQEKYKKKIFRPVALLPVTHDPFNGKRSFGLNLAMTF